MKLMKCLPTYTKRFHGLKNVSCDDRLAHKVTQIVSNNCYKVFCMFNYVLVRFYAQ